MTGNQVKEFNKKNTYIGVSKKSYGRTYFAIRDFKKGEVVMVGFGKIIDHQTPHISVQIGINKHYLPNIWTGRFWNHACESNTYMKTKADGFPSLVALKAIKQGEEITYSYWMSELRWTKYADESKIRCKCGSKNCKGKILSFSQLSKIEQGKIIHKKICAKYLMNLHILVPVALNNRVAISLVK